MTVKNFLSVVNDWEWVCVENDDYEVFGEDEAQTLRNSKEMNGLHVVCANAGIRSNKWCLVVIAERKSKK